MLAKNTLSQFRKRIMEELKDITDIILVTFTTRYSNFI